MKTIRFYIKAIFLFVSLFVYQSCEDFLHKPPLTEFTDDNYWTTETNLKTFAWELYDVFYGYGRGGTQYAEFYWQQEGNNNYEMMLSEDLLNSTFLSFPNGAYTTNSMWRNYYSFIRKCNLMLERIPDMNISEEAKGHWLGVAKFFRANSYFSLLTSWGEVPLVLNYLSPDDTENIYLPRSERSVVADQIISDLKDAVNSLKEDDGECAVNKNIAYALLARVCLYEGTYLKYHNISQDYNKYLIEAEQAAIKLIDSHKYYLSHGFKSKYNSDNLSDNKEIILYKHYEKNVMMHTIQAYTHSSAPPVHGLTKFAVESFVCQDGLPISQSPLYKGDRGIENVLSNRDQRLNNVVFDELGYYGKPYKDIIVSSTGYVTSLFDNPNKDIKDPDVSMDARNYIDAPVFTISEIYLIYAEAKAEMGTLTQNDLDISINLLRERAEIAPLKLNGSDVHVNGIIINDPLRTSSLESTTKGGIVNPIIWEIRRERRAELLGWLKLRFLDLKRWAKGEYLSSDLNKDVMLGAWIGTPPTGSTINTNAEGYIEFYPNNSRTFEDKFYLNPIPLNEIILYEENKVELRQNPGW